MEAILPDYRDPLFSILVIIGIVLTISIITYLSGLYKHQKESSKLLKFLEKFDTTECMLDTSNMVYSPDTAQALIILASAFESSGEFHKAISIYLYLTEHIEDTVEQNELLERLGDTYLKAGFLARSQAIYKEILRRRPRNIKVLYSLGVVYEMMQEYKKAKETLEPLKELGEDIYELEKFLDFAEISNNKSMPIKEKISKLQQLNKDVPELYRYIVSNLFKLDTKSAWQCVDTEKIDNILDILWFLQPSQLDFDTINNSDVLKTIYYTQGTLDEPIAKSGIFNIDILALAKSNNVQNATLTFSYLCKSCKESFPIQFTRCPSCMATNSIKVKEQIIKAENETDYSIF